MPGNRKAFEAFVLDFAKQITKGGGNAVIYERLFKSMSNKQMDDFVDRLEAGMPLSVWASNYDEAERLNYDFLVKYSKQQGLEIEQQLVVYDLETGIPAITPFTAIVGTAEVRKQRQMWVKKFNAAKNDSKIEDLTGQVMGESRATGMSIPEVQVLRNLGLPTLANELYNARGGDHDALKAYRNDLITTGKTSVNQCLKRGSIAKALSTASRMLRGRHIDNNLDKRYG